MSITVLDVGQPSVGLALRARAGELAQELAAIVGDLDGGVGPSGVGVDGVGGAGVGGIDAAALVATFAEVERLAAAGKTLAAGRVAASGHYRELGFATAGRWLADTTRDCAGEAGRVIITAQHLGDDHLAATRAAFVSGALTAAQAGEIARTVASAPEEEAHLLALAARETTARLRDECRKVRLAGRPPEDPVARSTRVADEMAFITRDLGDGMGELFARMPSAWLVLVGAAVREQCEAIYQRARADGRTDPHGAYMVESLVTLMVLGNLGGAGNAVDDGGDVEAAGAAGDVAGGSAGSGFDDPFYRQLLATIRGGPPPPLPRGARRRMRRGRCRCGGRVVPRAKIIVRVDQAALVRGWAAKGETCDIAGVGPVPVAAARDLWPDAVVKLVVTRGVDVANVTHLGRRATEAMATAMEWASPGCANVTCDNDRFVELDHRLGWANVGRTRVDELDGLCGQCHSWKTNHNWQLVRGRGRRRFVPPDHPDHPGDPPTPRRRA